MYFESSFRSLFINSARARMLLPTPLPVVVPSRSWIRIFFGPSQSMTTHRVSSIQLRFGGGRYARWPRLIASMSFLVRKTGETASDESMALCLPLIIFGAKTAAFLPQAGMYLRNVLRSTRTSLTSVGLTPFVFVPQDPQK